MAEISTRQSLINRKSIGLNRERISIINISMLGAEETEVVLIHRKQRWLKRKKADVWLI